LYISGFWGLHPQTPTGALPLDPAGGLLSLRSPVPTLTSEPSYATDDDVLLLLLLLPLMLPLLLLLLLIK